MPHRRRAGYGKQSTQAIEPLIGKLAGMHRGAKLDGAWQLLRLGPRGRPHAAFLVRVSLKRGFVLIPCVGDLSNEQRRIPEPECEPVGIAIDWIAGSRTSRVTVENRRTQRELIGRRQCHANAGRGFRIGWSSARQVLGRQHRPAEGRVHEKRRRLADQELLCCGELAETQIHIATDLLLNPEIEQARGRRGLDTTHEPDQPASFSMSASMMIPNRPS
jgi:hypothetical protein